MVNDWIRDYGVIGLSVALMLEIIALPIPGEAMLTFAGYLVHKGDLPFVPTIVAAFLGSACGISISYLIGRTLGLYLIHRWGYLVHITPDKVAKVHQWYERAGKWALTFGYYIPGVRHLTGVVAGSTKLELPVFALFAYAGCAIWVCSFISVGYFGGRRWEEASDTTQRVTVISLIIAAVIIAGFVFVRWLRRRKSRIPT